MIFSQEIIGILVLFLIFTLVLIKGLIDGDLYFDKDNFEIRVVNKEGDYNKRMYKMWR